MNIRELLKEEDVNIQVVVNIKDLREFAHVLIEEAITKLSPQKEETITRLSPLPKEKGAYLDVKQTCDILQVDRSTLWRWDKTGYLKPYRIGGIVRYRLSDINKLLSGESQQ